MQKKFRVWRKDMKIFLKDAYTPYNWLCNSFNEENLEFLYYTGLEDNQNNEIYEGHVLKIAYNGRLIIGQVVMGNRGSFCICPNGFAIKVPLCLLMISTLSLVEEKDFVILGDIYSNPELLGLKSDSIVL